MNKEQKYDEAIGIIREFIRHHELRINNGFETSISEDRIYERAVKLGTAARKD